MTTERNNPNIPSVVQAHSFQLVDDNGAVRGVLGMGRSQPYLALYDQNGIPRLDALLVSDSGDPSLVLSDQQGETRWYAGVYTTGEPVLTLDDESGSPRLMAFLDPTGKPSLRMLDQNGELLMLVGVYPDGQPWVSLRNQNGEFRFA